MTAARRLRADLAGRIPQARAAERLHQEGPRRDRGGRRSPDGRAGREAARGLGRATSWCEAGTARAQSLGWPDAYPYTKALGERALVSQCGEAVSPSPSCARRSSSPPWPSPDPAGSAASAWPSRSSSPTPAACCASSPGSPRASSTSSRWTWWWRPSSPWRRAGPRARAGPKVYHVASGCGTRCATGGWSSSSTDFFQQQPALRRAGPTDQRARVVLPRPRAGAAPAPPGRQP